MKKLYLNEAIIYLGIFILVFFTFCMPAWQFLSYNVHCDRLEDKCIVKETITGLTVKTIKISETNKLAVKSLHVPKKYGGTTNVDYLSLEKKDGSYSFVRGLLADTKDTNLISKFNNYINSTENTLDYTNKNNDFKAVAKIFVVVAWVCAFVVPLLEDKRNYVFSSEDKVNLYSIWNILIVIVAVLLLIAAFTTGTEAQKIKTEERIAAREEKYKAIHIASCSQIYELYPPGKMSIWLEDNNGKIFADFKVKNMTNEKLKELYKIDQHNNLKDGTKGIMEEGENTLTVRTQYHGPACIHKWTFYGKNECLNPGECYVEVVPYSEYYPGEAGSVEKFEFIKKPEDLNDKYVVTLRARRIN